LWSITGIPIAPGKVFEKFANTVFPDAEIKRVDGGLFGSITLDPPDPLQAALRELIDGGAFCDSALDPRRSSQSAIMTAVFYVGHRRAKRHTQTGRISPAPKSDACKVL
jgi:hypothetical protein